MTEALFFEILTARDTKMYELFAKFPQRDDPVAIVGHAGHLMRHEIKSREPASPAEKLLLFQRFSFNPELATGEFRLSEKHREGIDEWQWDQLESQQHFIERYETIHLWFPDLACYKAGQDPLPILEAQRRVAFDMTIVGAVYEAIKPTDFPPTASVGPAWAVYRWVQIQLLYGLEYLRRYGLGRRDEIGKRIANDVIDSQYLATGALADGLATGDGEIARLFRLLKPNSELRSCLPLAD